MFLSLPYGIKWFRSYVMIIAALLLAIECAVYKGLFGYSF